MLSAAGPAADLEVVSEPWGWLREDLVTEGSSTIPSEGLSSGLKCQRVRQGIYPLFGRSKQSTVLVSPHRRPCYLPAVLLQSSFD